MASTASVTLKLMVIANWRQLAQIKDSGQTFKYILPNFTCKRSQFVLMCKFEYQREESIQKNLLVKISKLCIMEDKKMPVTMPI